MFGEGWGSRLPLVSSVGGEVGLTAGGGVLAGTSQ